MYHIRNIQGGETVEFKLNKYHRNISDQELLNDIKRVSGFLDTNILSRDAYNKYGKYSRTTIERRFGSWKKALMDSSKLKKLGWKAIYNMELGLKNTIDILANIEKQEILVR